MENITYMEPTADCERVIYTPSDFARAELLHLQEAGHLTATKPHSSHRDKLNSFLLIIITAGSGTLSYRNNVHKLKAGDCAFIDCSEPYTHSTSSDPWSMSWVHFYGNNIAKIYDRYINETGNYIFTPYNTFPLLQLVDELFLLSQANDHIRDIKLHERLTVLLSSVLDEAVSYSLQRQNMSKWDVQLKNVRDYLSSHYAEKISLENVASQFYLNKFTMIRYFKDQYGMSPIAYLLQVRITKAKEMLRFTNNNIDEVAWKCGFPDGNYFSRAFKKIEHITPREYRRSWITKGEAN